MNRETAQGAGFGRGGESGAHREREERGRRRRSDHGKTVKERRLEVRRRTTDSLPWAGGGGERRR